MPMPARLLVAALLAACTTPTATTPAAAPATSAAVTPAPPPPAPAALAPTPYTADEIRDATKAGRTYDWRLERPNKPDVLRRVTFVAVNAESAEMTGQMLDLTGRPLAEPKASTVTWEELRKHAEFPAAQVSITDERITVPAGTFDCRVYTVTQGSGPDAEVTRYHFAKGLPGAPVLFFTEVGGQRVMTSTLVRYVPGG